jgi:hypothetical protein
MTDINIQLVNVITYLMDKLGVNEFEIPLNVMDSLQGKDIIATTKPLSNIVKVRIDD